MSNINAPVSPLGWNTGCFRNSFKMLCLVTLLGIATASPSMQPQAMKMQQVVSHNGLEVADLMPFNHYQNPPLIDIKEDGEPGAYIRMRPGYGHITVKDDNGRPYEVYAGDYWTKLPESKFRNRDLKRMSYKPHDHIYKMHPQTQVLEMDFKDTKNFCSISIKDRTALTRILRADTMYPSNVKLKVHGFQSVDLKPSSVPLAELPKKEDFWKFPIVIELQKLVVGDREVYSLDTVNKIRSQERIQVVIPPSGR